MHPAIQLEFIKKLSQITFQNQQRLIIYEASLLIESTTLNYLNGLVVVDASIEVRKKRLVQRDGLPNELADKIIASQMTSQVFRQYADYLIENNEDEKDLLFQKVQNCFIEMEKAT